MFQLKTVWHIKANTTEHHPKTANITPKIKHNLFLIFLSSNKIWLRAIGLPPMDGYLQHYTAVSPEHSNSSCSLGVSFRRPPTQHHSDPNFTTRTIFIFTPFFAPKFIFYKSTYQIKPPHCCFSTDI